MDKVRGELALANAQELINVSQAERKEESKRLNARHHVLYRVYRKSTKSAMKSACPSLARALAAVSRPACPSAWTVTWRLGTSCRALTCRESNANQLASPLPSKD